MYVCDLMTEIVVLLIPVIVGYISVKTILIYIDVTCRC